VSYPCVGDLLMKNLAHDKFFLLWALVLGIFFLIIAFWIPGFVKSIEIIRHGIGKQKDESVTQWKDQWGKTQKYMNEFIPSPQEQKKETPQPQENLFDPNSTSTLYEEKPIGR